MRRIHPALMTVTNLGVCNVQSFVPIINPPEAAILGVGKVLLTPVLRDADLKPLEEISGEARSLAERARAKKLQPNEYTGATFSISTSA